MRAQRQPAFLAFLALAFLACSFARAEDVPISLSETYGAFSVKWVTDATAQNNVQHSAMRNAAKSQKKLEKLVQHLAKKPDLSHLEKMKSQLETLLAKSSGQTTMLLWASAIQTVGLTPQVGMTGTVSVGDGSSATLQQAFTLSQQYSSTVQGHPITVFYSELPAATDTTVAFNALILSDELSALGGPATTGIWLSAIVNPHLAGALASYGVANTTTSADGVAVSVGVGLSFDTQPLHSGAGSFGDTYFSIQDLFGVGVPPQAVDIAKANFAKLQEKLAHAH